MFIAQHPTVLSVIGVSGRMRRNDNICYKESEMVTDLSDGPLGGVPAVTQARGVRDHRTSCK